MANKVIDILLKATDGGAAALLGDTTETITGIGMEAGKTTTKTDELDQSLQGAGSAGDKLKGTLEGLRNGGAILAGLGAAGLLLANRFTQAAIEADGLGSKTEALLSGQGLHGAIDQVKELGLQLALATGLDDDELSSKIAEAVASGRVMSLRQYGIVVDKLGQQSITAAQGVSAQAGAQEALNQIMKASIPAIQTLRDTSSAAALAAGELDVRWGNIEENIGEGTGVIKAALYNNVLSPLLDIAEANPELLKTGGAVFAIGSAGLSAVGGIVAVGSQVGLLVMTLPGIGVAASGAFGMMKIAAASTIPFLAGVASALAVPFAILAAGLAAGIAGYEALRALNIGGFGDTHKSTKEIFADTRKTIMGDPAAEAAKATAVATAAMPTTPTMPAMPSIPSLTTVATAMPVNSGGTPWIDTSRPEPRAGGSLTIRPKTQVTQNAAGDYVLKILPTDVVIPNDFSRAVGAL